MDEWALKLRTVESVLGVWQKVQANWSRSRESFARDDVVDVIDHTESSAYVRSCCNSIFILYDR